MSELLEHVDLRALQHELLEQHGPQGWWWPGEEPFEIAVGAVLVQRSRWEQAAISIANLRAAGLLEPASLAHADEETVRDLVRGSGFPTSKPARLQALARWTIGTAATAGGMSDRELRASLLRVDGIGEETADAISLYCHRRPVFICDEYARRLLAARGFVVPRSYAGLRRQLAPAVERAAFSALELAELHGLIVEEGKRVAAARARPRSAEPAGSHRRDDETVDQQVRAGDEVILGTRQLRGDQLAAVPTRPETAAP